MHASETGMLSVGIALMKDAISRTVHGELQILLCASVGATAGANKPIGASRSRPGRLAALGNTSSRPRYPNHPSVW